MEFMDKTVVPLIVVAGSFVALWFARLIFFKLLRRISKSAWLHPEVIIGVIKHPSMFWCVIGALHVGVTVSEMPERISSFLHLLIEAGLILTITVVIANGATVILRQSLSKIGSAISSSGLIYGVLRATVYMMGILMLLSRVGISIAPLITALGVGGAAVALALKDTLENVFSGIQLLIDKAIRVGDLVRLEGGQEGEIVDIGWRTSKLKAGVDTIILPNSKLSQSILLRKDKRD